ncbi:MAG: cyclic nucleotide-binding and patatin-like phospholipase domain-containing protein [Caldilineaceae bacterium]
MLDITVLKSPKSVLQSPTPDVVAQLAEAVGACPKQFTAGTVLATPDEPITTVYAIRTGQVEVLNQAGVRLQQLDAGAFVGALEVWTGRTWGLTVRVTCAGAGVAIAADAFRQLVRINPALRQAAGEAVTVLMRQVQLAEALTRCLGTLDQALLDLVASGAQWRQLNAGDCLFPQGAWGDSLFLVLGGRLQRVYGGADGVERVVGHVTAGESVGHFLAAAPHAVTVRAVRESTVIELPFALCQQLWQQFPQAMLPFLRHATQQQQAILAALDVKPTPPTTIAIIPATGDIDLVQFTHLLAEAMQPYGGVLTLTRASVDAQYGQKRVADIAQHHPLHPLLVDWLNEQERTHRHVLYIGDATWSEWTRRCLRQADRILLVADAQHDPAPTLIEQAIYAHTPAARIDLVLLHPPGLQQIQGTAAWLAPRPIHTHYHVRQQDKTDVGALARRLTGNAVALVLSGGGARGYAHLGVLRGMEELDIPCDLVGATSMGTLVAMVPALGWNYADAMARSAIFANPKKLFDYTLPLVSVFASDKLTAALRALVGEQRIEDLWRPFFAISTDLTASQTVVHERGLLWRAIRASLAIPGVFSPLIDEQGHILVDGGIMNNFPADVMRERVESGKIIGVNLGHVGGRNKQYALGPSVSGWRLLRSRLNPLEETIEAPSLAGILMRTTMVNNEQVTRKTQQACDLLLEPDVHRFGLLQFADYAAIAEAGYTATKELLRQFKKAHL